MLTRSFDKLAVVVILLFVGTLLSGVFLPIYSDEVMAKWSLGRFFLDEQMLLSFFPQCSATMGRSISLIFYPAGALLAFLFSGLDLLGSRVSGIALGCLWFGVVGYWCYRQTLHIHGTINRLACLIAISSLGVAPYLWVLSRPEQVLTLCAVLLCLFASFNNRTSLIGKVLSATGLAITLSCFFLSHPKSIFFLPFVLVVTGYATQKYGRYVQVLFLLFVVLLSYQVFRDASGLATCNDAPYVQKVLAMNTLLPSMLITDPWGFTSAALHNLYMFPARFLQHLSFNQSFQSGWLPPLGVSNNALLIVLNALVIVISGAVVIGTHIGVLAFFAARVFKGSVPPWLVISASLAGADVLNVIFYNLQNFYAGTQFFPLTIILLVLMHSPIAELASKTKFSTVLRTVLFGCATASMITLLCIVTPSLVKNSSWANADIPDQPLSVPTMNASTHLEAIRALGEKCDIPESGSKNLVLDHMTYFAYSKNENPIHVLYVSEQGYGNDLLGGKLLPFLKAIKSPGVIARCEWIPSELRPLEQKGEMGYCCVSLKSL
jgi:hypothetical protein